MGERETVTIYEVKQGAAVVDRCDSRALAEEQARDYGGGYVVAVQCIYVAGDYYPLSAGISESRVNKHSVAVVRRRALAKLSIEEREALGLDDGDTGDTQ